MDIVCSSCSKTLTIADENLPKDVDVVSAQCPLCRAAIQIRLREGSTAAPAPSPAPETPPQPEPEAPPDPGPSEPSMAASADAGWDESFVAPLTEDSLVEGRRLAMVCLDDPHFQSAVKTELEALGYTPHIPLKTSDSVRRLRQNKYEVVILHEEYGGPGKDNPVLKTLQPMSMNLRRHMCVGLVGKKFKTLDPMTAFAKSVNFVIAEQELDKVKAVTLHAVSENDRFYRVFRSALEDSGKA